MSRAATLAISAALGFALWIALAAAAPASTAADPLARPRDPEARAQLAAGNRLYRLREFDRAIVAYKAGALAEDAPVFQYNLAQCLRQLGRLEDAIWHYERFVSRGRPTGQLAAAVAGFLAELRRDLASRPPPAPEPAPPGPALAAPPTAAPAARTFTMLAPPPAWYRDPLAWTATGAGAIALTAAGLLALDARRLEHAAADQPRASLRGDLRDRAGDRRWQAAGLALGAGSLLAAGVIKLALRPGPRHATYTIAVTGDGDRAGVVVGGRF